MDYSIKNNVFEGPLDLLLHLIKKSNINIYDISISDITAEYLAYINKMKELNINVAASYLVMAAELMVIKSKSLLPVEEKEEETDEINTKEKLIEKLIEYQKYKDVTEKFKNLELKRRDIFVKLPESVYNYIDENKKIETKSSVDELFLAFQQFLERQKLSQPLQTKITNKEYSIKERTNEIKNILLKEKKVQFTKLFDKYQKDYIIITFLSILEMAKENIISICQNHNFEDITLELNEGSAK